MFREMHYADRNFVAMDLAEKMAERHRHSLAATSKATLRVWMTRMLIAVAMTTETPEAEGRA
jgi:hypothetical protein